MGPFEDGSGKGDHSASSLHGFQNCDRLGQWPMQVGEFGPYKHNVTYKGVILYDAQYFF